jgi:uncharacterized protein DUF6551
MALVKDVADVQTTKSRYGGEVALLRLGELEVDTRFQRPMNEARVKRMQSTFDPTLVGLLTVSARTGGHYVLLDGQHRWMVLVNMGYTDALCEVLDNLTLEQEATIFHGRNVGRVRLGIGDYFRARLTAKEPTALAIMKLVTAAGFQIDLNPGRNWKNAASKAEHIVAIHALERVYNIGLLGQTLLAVRHAWPNQPAFFMKSDLILGIGGFLRTYPEADAGRITKQWSYYSPHAIIAAAMANTTLVGRRSGWTSIVEVLRDAYNRNQKGSRLPMRDVNIYAMRQNRGRDLKKAKRDDKGLLLKQKEA